ncbi:MAG: AAA family ATPase [Oribacterium sp.]|nr:AAA family ATPase [Oribacterium sp.]
MNIKEAKEQIKNAMTAYFTKDEFGGYMVPIQKQRPVFLMGPPGIGKTAIMEQIASELGVGILSYSMTHHTRQSALGLPFIVHKKYGEEEFDVSEYTMSEIISAVYDLMESTGVKEGILFLDEINCVSETLSPIMLQFLQYKIFGRNRVPDGWIVVTAGNPPEYNNSVREFDIVTWDRLKRIDVEPDFDVWKEYAYKAGVHASVMTYLETKKADFYKVETTTEGKSFITARGWDDLSQMIILYEKNGLKVDGKLIEQYIQNKKIAKSFAVYYDLFNKYRSDYQVNDILAGKASDSIKNRAKAARFDERLSLLGLMLDNVSMTAKSVIVKESMIRDLMGVLAKFKMKLQKVNTNGVGIMTELAEERRRALDKGKKSGSLSSDDQYRDKLLIQALEEMAHLAAEGTPQEIFARVKGEFDRRVKEFKAEVADTGKRMNNMFLFTEEVYPDGQELLILVTELTINPHTSGFISKYGCEEYFKHNKELLFYERQQALLDELLDLGEL